MGMLLVVSGRLKSTYLEFAAVHFFAEASLIGGPADRFAVVALFSGTVSSTAAPHRDRSGEQG